jgi:hypothetical protein
MEFEVSLQRSQEPSTGPYCEHTSPVNMLLLNLL